MPAAEAVEAGDADVGQEKHEPHEHAHAATAVSPPGFIGIAGQRHGEQVNEDQHGKRDVRREQAGLQSVMVMLWVQECEEGLCVPALRVEQVADQVGKAEQQYDDAHAQGQGPEALKAGFQDIEVGIMGQEGKAAEHQQHIERHEAPGDLPEACVHDGRCLGDGGLFFLWHKRIPL